MTSADHDRLAVLVHEVRSPVAALGAVSAALSDASNESASRRTLVGLALAACRGIDRLVTDVTLASVQTEEVDVVRLCEDVVRAVELRGGRVRMLTSAAAQRAEVDPHRLRQALDNLLANAVSVSPPHEPVVLSLDVDCGTVRIGVSDSGPGIPASERERIFEPGVQLDGTRPGSGLGLTIARAIAEAHGGTLTVRSGPGRGSTFTLTLATLA